MKNTYFIFIIILFSSVFVGCYSDSPPEEHIEADQAPIDTLKTRTSIDKQRRLSVKDAFIKLSNRELVLEGLKSMTIQERKSLLKLEESAHYDLKWVGNYLQITEKASNKDDEFERIEQVRLAAFNSLSQKNILFISQELIDEQRQTTQIIHQAFLQYSRQHWEDIRYQLPTITTQTFLDNGSKLNIKENHIYFDLKAQDVNYLQARLKHESYPDKDKIAQNEAYKVALIWTGNDFRLNRQAMVQYDISERHTQ